jgi:hypothetical protein
MSDGTIVEMLFLTPFFLSVLTPDSSRPTQPFLTVLFVVVKFFPGLGANFAHPSSH